MTIIFVCHITGCQPALTASPSTGGCGYYFPLISSGVWTVWLEKLHKHGLGLRQAQTVVILENLWNSPYSDRKCNAKESVVRFWKNALMYDSSI